MSPYIVTVKHPLKETPYGDTRHAVATLDGARDYADAICRGIPHQPGEIGEWLLAMDSFPESGGTVGPLPDGTVIEVEPVKLGALIYRTWAGVEPKPDDWNSTDAAQVIARYNEAQAS